MPTRGFRPPLRARVVIGRFATTVTMPDTRALCRRSICAALLAIGCRSDSRAPEHASPFHTADSLLSLRRWAQAHPHYRRLRDSFAVAQDSAGWWKAQLWWAQTLMRLGRTDSSEVAIREAFALAGRDSSRQGWTYWLRCGLWSRLGKPEDAIADCGVALDRARAAGDGELEARTHFVLGTVYSRRGLYRISVVETERALALERRFGRSQYQLAGVLNSMGVEYAAVGRLPEAGAAYEEGLVLARSLADTSTAGVIISNLAALRAYTGRLDLAIALMEGALLSARAVGDSSSIAYALNSLGDYYRQAGNHAKARARLTESLGISAAQSPAVYRVMARLNLGLVELAEGSSSQATATLEQALPPAVSGGFGLERFEIHAALASLAIGRRDAGVARRHLAAARTIADSLGSPDVEFRTLELEGRVRELEGRADAPRQFLQAIEFLESWRGRLALGDLRLGLAEPRWSVYEAAIRSLLAHGDTVRAFDVAERAKARTLLEIVAERNPSEQALPVAALKQRLRQKYEERTAATDSVARVLDLEIGALTDSLQLMEAADGSRDGRTATRYPRPASLADVRAALLGSDKTAIYSVFWGDSAAYGWWVTRDAVHARRLGRVDSLAATLDFLHEALVTPSRDSLWRRAAARAYERLIAPFAPGDVSTILALVDGPLARVPIEVLLPDADALPLGATHRIIYGPSASVLAAVATLGPAAGQDRALLAVGYPGGQVGGARSRGGSERDGRTATEAIPLPNAEREARAIRDLYRDQGAELLLGSRATVARWMERRPGRFRYLHFATHARADDREPDGGRLFLADGALDVPAIRRLEIGADLVSLSACETAMGRQVRGEGVLGLAHAFLAAGARSALVTLWPVIDQPAADFMTEFYGEVRLGASPADALLTVRRRWIDRGGPSAHPSWWAPFILYGKNATATQLR